MQTFRENPFEGYLEVISTLSGDAMRASLQELREQDRLTMGLRQAIRYGVSVDELSARTGLTPEAIPPKLTAWATLPAPQLPRPRLPGANQLPPTQETGTRPRV